ncbi:MAG: hypothetical protein ACLP5H_16785 [Desulfomonilaceae bacterium]
MQRPLPISIVILALFLAVPALSLAWAAELRPGSQEFDDKPKFSDSMRNSGGVSFQNSPATAVNIPAPSQKPPAVSKPLYLPNVARDPRAPETEKTGLANILSFLLPTKEDLGKCFKAEDQGFLDRGRSSSDPFQKRDWK